MYTLEKIKTQKMEELKTILVSYKNSRQTSYYQVRVKHQMRKWTKEVPKIVVPLKPVSLSVGSVIYRSPKTTQKNGVKLWDCGSKKQSLAILAEL